MNAITRTAILLVFVSSVSSCTTTRKTDPEPAKMTLEENGKLVRMSYFDGAPFASIHDTPKEYCRSRQEKEVQLGFRIDYSKPERTVVYYCSNGSATDKAFIESWQQRRIAEYNAWVQSQPAGKPLSQEEQEHIAKQHIDRLQRNYGVRVN